MRQAPSGFFQFQSQGKSSVSGFGTADYVRLKDDQGNVWRGAAEVMDDESIFYRFRNVDGKTISGRSDGYGILLRDERGQIWRGYVY